MRTKTSPILTTATVALLALSLTACTSGGKTTPSPTPGVITGSSSSPAPTGSATSTPEPSETATKPNDSSVEFDAHLKKTHPEAANNFYADAAQLMNMFYGGTFGDLLVPRTGDEVAHFGVLEEYLSEKGWAVLKKAVSEKDYVTMSALIPTVLPSGDIIKLDGTTYSVDPDRKATEPVLIGSDASDYIAHVGKEGDLRYTQLRKVTVFAKQGTLEFTNKVTFALVPNSDNHWVIDSWSSRTHTPLKKVN